jgi:hypothetical protein
MRMSMSFSTAFWCGRRSMTVAASVGVAYMIFIFASQ